MSVADQCYLLCVSDGELFAARTGSEHLNRIGISDCDSAIMVSNDGEMYRFLPNMQISNIDRYFTQEKNSKVLFERLPIRNLILFQTLAKNFLLQNGKPYDSSWMREDLVNQILQLIGEQ